MAMHHRRINKRQTKMLQEILAELEAAQKCFDNAKGSSGEITLENCISKLAHVIVSEGHIKGRR